MLTKTTRKEFKKAYGSIHTSVSEILNIIFKRKLVSIGDRISYNFLKEGVCPNVVVFDGKEKKQPVDNVVSDILNSVEGKEFRVRNPPGGVTEELWKAVREAVKIERAKIVVDGEEDMAFLPSVLESKVGTVILYGFYDRGFVLTEVDNDLKEKMEKILAKMNRGR